VKNWFRSRKYRSGTSWCFWRWTDVQTEYILRLHLVKTPWFAICVHWLNKPDPDPHLHDHPVSFLSLILRGFYVERREDLDGKGERYVGNVVWNFIRATTRHRIDRVAQGTVTLCFMGPKVQDWGFFVPGRGKVFWKDYYREQEKP
jgi:hypothetical protein